MLWLVAPRIAAVLAGIYSSWWSYRLFTNPFVACDNPGRRLVARTVESLCNSKQTEFAGVLVALSAALLFLFAFWPRRRSGA